LWIVAFDLCQDAADQIDSLSPPNATIIAARSLGRDQETRKAFALSRGHQVLNMEPDLRGVVRAALTDAVEKEYQRIPPLGVEVRREIESIRHGASGDFILEEEGQWLIASGSSRGSDGYQEQ